MEEKETFNALGLFKIRVMNLEEKIEAYETALLYILDNPDKNAQKIAETVLNKNKQ